MAERSLHQLRSRMTTEQINALPIRHYEGPVHLITTPEEFLACKEDLTSCEVLGFDTETRPTFRKGRVNDPSLVQLATEQAVYLIWLLHLPFGPYLAEILSNPAQIKVGVGILCDMKALVRIFPFVPNGLVDLGTIAKQNRIPAQGLRSLCATFFGWRISKSLQCSNWGGSQLSDKQILYAATDAWVSRLIYLTMQELRITVVRQTSKRSGR